MGLHLSAYTHLRTWTQPSHTLEHIQTKYIHIHIRQLFDQNTGKSWDYIRLIVCWFFPIISIYIIIINTLKKICSNMIWFMNLCIYTNNEDLLFVFVISLKCFLKISQPFAFFWHTQWRNKIFPYFLHSNLTSPFFLLLLIFFFIVLCFVTLYQQATEGLRPRRPCAIHLLLTFKRTARTPKRSSPLLNTFIYYIK